MVRRARLAPLLVCLVALGAGACKGASKGKPPDAGSAQENAAMGSWNAWLDLGPLLEVARSHAPPKTVVAIEQASKLLRDGKAKTADRGLAMAADSEGRHWVSVARADLAALYFTRCIRGVVWRLEDLSAKTQPTRRSDFSEDTKIEPGDVSVEALLTNLDLAVAAKEPALQIQARIARARVTAYSARCAANDEVAQMSEGILKTDLATLAAEGHLTPDLAYLWAGVQMAEYSGAAAKPFLLLAKDGGYTDPALTYMLGVIALEQRDLGPADAYAIESAKIHEKLGDKDQHAQSLFLRGEVARARKDPAAARKHYEAAQQLAPGHPAAVLGVARIVLTAEGSSRAIAYIQKALPQIVLTGPLAGDRLRIAATNLEALSMLATESEIAALCRDAMLAEVELEPDVVRRGLRYFIAATLDARLGEYTHARAHALLARDEFIAAPDVPVPVDVAAFLERLDAVAPGG